MVVPAPSVVANQLFGRSMELEANRQGSEAAEPSNLLESMLGTVLVFVRECPQVGGREEGGRGQLLHEGTMTGNECTHERGGGNACDS